MKWPEKLKEMPRVKMVMSPFPYSIESGDTLAEAERMMNSYRIHHLPVMEGGIPVGIISHRDLRRAVGEGSATALTVADIPRQEAHVVDLSEPLDQVLLSMARRRLGAALVVKEGRLAGIFTLTDACQCFAEHLRQQFPPPGGDEAA